MPPEQSFRTGLRAFFVVWLGQVVSILGSSMVGFGVSIWLFQQTGQASTLTWAMFAFFAPVVFLSPFAGTIVDRSNRKAILIVSDLVSGLTTIVMLALLLSGNLAVWQIYILNFINGAFNSLQFPAFSAAITMMVEKKHYARTSGMMEMAGAASNIIAPALAAVLLVGIGLEGLLIIDIVTFVAAITTVAFVHIPQPPKSDAGREGAGSFLQETAYGFRYIFKRPSLLGLQLVFMGINFTAMIGFAVIVPMVLARTNNNELALGTTQSVASMGGVLGGVVLGIWGGPKKKVNGVLGGMLLSSLLGSLLMGVGTTVVMWSIAGFLGQFFIPIINGSNQAIWQAKVPPDVQGRVFSVRRLIAQMMGPIVTAFAGPLADNVFEPAMREGGALANTFGWIVGNVAGSGMSLMFVISGVLGIVVALIGYSSPVVRDAEMRLADHEVAVGS